MKKAKKILVMVAALALTAALAIGGTLAYLTAKTVVVKNTFTVGKVEITLDEAPVDEYGVAVTGDRRTTNEYKLIPGHNYKKDPTVHVASGSEESWLFVKVENGIKNIEAKPEQGQTDTTSIAAQMDDKGWTLVSGQTDVYAYASKVKAGDNIPVFDSFTLAGDADVAQYVTEKDAEGNITNEDVIFITAYAVQADGFGSAADAWAKAPASWT